MKAPSAPHVEGFVLAGGRSTRMGRDKAMLEWKGVPLVEQALGSLRHLGLQARIAGSRADLGRFAEVVPDLHPGCGPVSGIEAALVASDAELNLFLPVDLPLLPEMFLRWMLDRVTATAALATIPMVSGMPQPLCAVYHQALLPGLTASLVEGEYKVMRAITHAVSVAGRDGQHMGVAVDSFHVEEVFCSRFDWPADMPVGRWFQNMNTPADLAAV